MSQRVNRREFLACSAMGLAATSVKSAAAADREEIIDIHQHAHYLGRSRAGLVNHQRALGVSKTILLD